MSSASTKSMSRSIPSTSTSGVVLAPNVLCPRIQNSALDPGSPVRCITTIPASLPARFEESEPLATSSSPASMVLMAPMILSLRCLPYATTVTASSSETLRTSSVTMLVFVPTGMLWVS